MARLEGFLAQKATERSPADAIGANMSSAQALLANLRKRLDEPVSWDQKRRLVEVLVGGVRVDTVEVYGVKQSEITVTHRFSQPDQPMPLALPQSYSTGRVVRVPTVPQSIGIIFERGAWA